MRIVLRITSGPEAGRTITIGPGERRLIGRAPKADERITSDEYLSDLHVALTTDDSGALSARDLYSSNGTFLNGEPMEESALKHGDTLRAGATEMEVIVEGEPEAVAPPPVSEPTRPMPPKPSPPVPAAPVFGAPPPRVVLSPAALGNSARALVIGPPAAPLTFGVPPAAPTSVPGPATAPGPTSPFSSEAELIALLEAGPGDLFAVVDAARDTSILEILRGERVEALHTGRRGDRPASAAPYIASLPQGSQLLRDLVQRGWGKSWCIFLASNAPFEEVRDHLRKLLVVEKGGGETLYFRFYDPRILRAFLPSCMPEQVSRFFGPILQILIEAAEADAILRFGVSAPAAPPPAEAASTGKRPGDLLALRPVQIEMIERHGRIQ